MNQLPGVLMTDGVNRHKMLLPLSALTGSIERHLQDCIRRELPVGMPTNMAHDQCRPVGWSFGAGVHIASDMARLLGCILTPESDEERARLHQLIRAFRIADQQDRAAPYVDELIERLTSFVTEEAVVWCGEAAALFQPNLAAAALPDLFSVESDLVDKDGLVDYRALLQRVTQVHPGVFHEPKRDILLFAHPYFRRSLSRMNSLNQYVLRSFDETALADPAVAARLRLDPDLIGHPASALPVMELEYWHGPRFSDDIAIIPAGVSEHKSDASARTYSGVDKTQIWWKAPEQRRSEERGLYDVRTFEVEELIEDPSPGLAEDHFGCRYAHAEFDMAEGVISHFDVAIRAYEGSAYLERLDRLIDRAGKYADYTKLLRLDGPVAPASWKRVLTDFYRGNGLIPEYLGAPSAASPETAETQSDIRQSRTPRLCAFIGLSIEREHSAPAICEAVEDQAFAVAGQTLTFAEVGLGETADLMRRWIGSQDMRLMSARDDRANLSTIRLPAVDKDPEAWERVTSELAQTLLADAKASVLREVSTAFRWVVEGVSTILSVAGDADLVAALLREAGKRVRPDQPAQLWVEGFRDALVHLAPPVEQPVHWSPDILDQGRLFLEREGDIELSLRLGEGDNVEKLLENGGVLPQGSD